MTYRNSQQTLSYKVYLKEKVVEALQIAFHNHPDPEVADTKVTLEYPVDINDYPAVVILFSERDIPAAGIGHVEWFQDEQNPNLYDKYHCRLYHGDLVFEIMSLTALTRDIISDALTEVVGMTDVTTGGFNFQKVIYDLMNQGTYRGAHFVQINTDLFNGSGEGPPQLAPWMPEDQVIYRSNYRVPLLGQVYSIPPAELEGKFGLVTQVNTYPYDPYNGETDPEPDVPYLARFIYAGPDLSPAPDPFGIIQMPWQEIDPSH